MKKYHSFFALMLVVTGAGAEVLPPLDKVEFAQCLRELQQKARTEGIDEAIVIGTLGKLTMVDRVIELDRKQPEFTQTFAGYFNKRVTDGRVEQGRNLLKEYRPLLDKLTKEYGVPAQYLLAFWGMETNFGGYKGKMPVLDSLATLACDHRRSDYFTEELMQALKLKQKYGFSREQMVGSWAGAMGHTQFMPSTYTSYAVDHDGDGKADLWNSTDDALSSAAHFLQQLGWQRNERWGREVVLPAGFDYGLLSDGKTRSLKQWGELGLTQANGGKLPSLAMQATLQLPAGASGPAFLTYSNFDVIMRWNRSVFYALSVGHLADRIIGAGKLKVAPPKQTPLSRDTLKQLQIKLNELGYEVGKPDGILGPKSIAGLRAYQLSQDLVADGYPQPQTLQKLGILR